MQYSARYAKDRYRLGRVLKLSKGRDGLVRTVTVGLRNQARGAGEPRGECRAGLTTIDLPVQRLVLILPGEEQPEEIVRGLRHSEVVTPRAPEVVTPRVSQPGGRIRVSQQDQPSDEIIDL